MLMEPVMQPLVTMKTKWFYHDKIPGKMHAVQMDVFKDLGSGLESRQSEG